MRHFIHSLSDAKALAELRKSVNRAQAAALPGAHPHSRPPLDPAPGAMLGESAASAYLARHAVDTKIAQRVLSKSGRRRSSDGAEGLID